MKQKSKQAAKSHTKQTESGQQTAETKTVTQFLRIDDIRQVLSPYWAARLA